MNNRRRHGRFMLSAGLLAACCYAGAANAQSELLADTTQKQAVAQTTQTFNISRNTVMQPFADGSLGDAVNLNLQLNFSPMSGLDLSAGAWRQDATDSTPLALSAPDTENLLAPRLYIEESLDTALEQPFSVLPGEAQGLDLSASYVWDSPRFGQFIVSTKASYIYDYRQNGSFRESGLTPSAAGELPLIANPEIKSSLTLTWQIGNHTASAVTHYADSFDELGAMNLDMNLEEFNKLVGDLTTLDFQYGYSLKAGKQGNAIFSLGIRNVLDKRASEFTEAGRVTEPNGRMAYGSIKYQF